VKDLLQKWGLTALLLIDEQRQQPPRKRAALPHRYQNPMGQRAMHEGGFRKNVLRNLLLKAGEIVSSIVTEIKGRHFELVQGQGLEHRFEKYLVSPAAPPIDVD
jgi:hypothetical protein